MTNAELASLLRRGAEVVKYASVAVEPPHLLAAEMEAAALELEQPAADAAPEE